MSGGIKAGEGIYLFYRLDGTGLPLLSVSMPPGFRTALWSPSLSCPWPHGTVGRRRGHFLFRTLLHVLGIFPSRDSGALVIYKGDTVAHYSAFTPRYWRFPFLADEDIQIGDTWTEPNYRGKGLAKLALHKLLGALLMSGRRFWYVVDEMNRPSIKVAEQCGFRLAGVGTRVPRMKAFDHYEILETRQSP